MNLGFESFVNSEECKTFEENTTRSLSLRALLIQKSVKRNLEIRCAGASLRALLIQKSVKPFHPNYWRRYGLRALLIQKSVKRFLVCSCC